MPQTMMRTTEASSQINPVYKSAVRRRGSAAKGCLIALAVALVLGMVGGAAAQWEPTARLGLSAVQGIVQSHGGFVRLQSEVGRGTTFFFTLLRFRGDV